MIFLHLCDLIFNRYTTTEDSWMRPNHRQISIVTTFFLGLLFLLCLTLIAGRAKAEETVTVRVTEDMLSFGEEDYKLTPNLFRVVPTTGEFSVTIERIRSRVGEEPTPDDARMQVWNRSWQPSFPHGRALLRGRIPESWNSYTLLFAGSYARLAYDPLRTGASFAYALKKVDDEWRNVWIPSGVSCGSTCRVVVPAG